jgi:hypothetical protein
MCTSWYQWSRDVVTARVQTDVVQSLHINVESSTNQLTCTSQKIGTHPTIILSYASTDCYSISGTTQS